MSGFAAVIAHEWRLLRSAGVLSVAVLALAIALLAAAWNGRALLTARVTETVTLGAEMRDTVRALRKQAATYRGDWAGAPAAVDPGAVGFSVLTETVVLPPAPLAAIAVGQSDLLANSYGVTARSAYSFLGLTTLDSPLRLAIGSFDLAFVIVWLLPLLVIALSYDAVAADRHNGVLALVAAQGVPLRKYVFGRLLARATIVLGVLTLLLPLALWVAGIEFSSSTALTHITLALLVTLAYAVFWLAAALWLNSRPLSPEANAGILAGLWLLLVVVMPTATNLVATTLFPAPSRVQLTTELREATESADKQAAEQLDHYFFDHPDMATGTVDKTQFNLIQLQTESTVGEAMRARLAAFAAQAARQQQLVDRLALLSPGTGAHQALAALAGSDGVRQHDFRQQTLRFHARWAGFFADRIGTRVMLTERDYDQLPKFHYQELTRIKWQQRVWAPLAAIVSMSLLVAWLAFFALRNVNRQPAELLGQADTSAR